MLRIPTSRAPLRALVLAIALAACGFVAATWHEFGHTWDEPEHIAAGMALLDHNVYDYDLQHPPLARMLLALGPYLAGARSHNLPPPDGRAEGLAILYDGANYERYLRLARTGALPFLILLIAATWWWARRLLPTPGALLAVALLASTPVVLGHAGIAALDIPAAATCLAALYAIQRWLETGTWRKAAWLGAAVGLAVGTKLSAIPFLGLGLIVLAGARTIDSAGRESLCAWLATRRAWGGAALAFLLCAAILTLAYGGRFEYLTDETHRFNQALWYLFGDDGVAHDVAYSIAAHVPVPEAVQLILGGIEALQTHNESGHLSYLLGESHTHGWWYFYLVALAVKTPLTLLIPGLIGLGLQAVQGWRRGDAWLLAPPLLFVVLLAFCSIVSRINIGVRHVLILYPLLAIGAAHALTAAWRAVDRVKGERANVAARGAVLLVVVLQASLVLRAYPDYLAWFNVLAPHPERVVVDSDLDWGQDLRRLERRLAQLRVPSVALGYLGTADLAREPLPNARPLAPGERTTGWVAVFALARAHAKGGYDWLDAYGVRERVGRTIDLYFVPPSADPPPAR